METFIEILKNENINNTNFHSIYKILKNESVVKSLPKTIYYSDYFLENFYVFEDLILRLLKRDPLFRYRLIDFFKDNYVNITEKREIIKKFHKQNIGLYSKIMEFCKDDTDISDNTLSVYNDIDVNMDLFRSYIFSSLWKPNYFIHIDIQKLSNRLLLLYYFNLYIIKNRSNELKIEDENYVEFLKFLTKNKNEYFINKEFNNIIFRKDLKKQDYCIENGDVLYYFNDCKHPSMVNKNVITWFFIIFNKSIPRELYNDFLYIILGFKKNTIGAVVNLMKKLGKPIIDITEKEKEEISKVIKNNYVFRENDEIENPPDIHMYINNVILLNKKTDVVDLFLLIPDVFVKENFFFIQEKDPLKTTKEELEFFIKETCRKFEKTNISLKNLAKIHNALMFKKIEDCSQPMIMENGTLINLWLSKLVNEEYDKEYTKMIDKKCLFYTMLKNLFNFEILLPNFKDIDSVNNYFRDVNYFKEIFEKLNKKISFYNGYKKLE